MTSRQLRISASAAPGAVPAIAEAPVARVRGGGLDELPEQELS
ncbi:hypothetical protein [Streptomyces violascens]